MKDFNWRGWIILSTGVFVIFLACSALLYLGIGLMTAIDEQNWRSSLFKMRREQALRWTTRDLEVNRVVPTEEGVVVSFLIPLAKDVLIDGMIFAKTHPYYHVLAGLEAGEFISFNESPEPLRSVPLEELKESDFLIPQQTHKEKGGEEK